MEQQPARGRSLGGRSKLQSIPIPTTNAYNTNVNRNINANDLSASSKFQTLSTDNRQGARLQMANVGAAKQGPPRLATLEKVYETNVGAAVFGAQGKSHQGKFSLDRLSKNDPLVRTEAMRRHDFQQVKAQELGIPGRRGIPVQAAPAGMMPQTHNIIGQSGGQSSGTLFDRTPAFSKMASGRQGASEANLYQVSNQRSNADSLMDRETAAQDGHLHMPMLHDSHP